MSGPRDCGIRPDGPLSTLLYNAYVRHNVGLNHCFAEGCDLPRAAVLEGYDRTEYPWIHGRRPHDLARKLRDRLPFLEAA